MKADLADALLAGGIGQDDEDSFDPPQEQGQLLPSQHVLHHHNRRCDLKLYLLFMPSSDSAHQFQWVSRNPELLTWQIKSLVYHKVFGSLSS